MELPQAAHFNARRWPRSSTFHNGDSVSAGLIIKMEILFVAFGGGKYPCRQSSLRRWVCQAFGPKFSAESLEALTLRELEVVRCCQRSEAMLNAVNVFVLIGYPPYV